MAEICSAVLTPQRSETISPYKFLYKKLQDIKQRALVELNLGGQAAPTQPSLSDHSFKTTLLGFGR